MKPGELKPLTDEQKIGLKKADEVRAALVKAVQEDWQKRPYSKRKGK
jgi:hypothetical protein